MIEPFWGFDDEVSRWVAAQVPGCERGFDTCRALGIMEDGELIGGVVYHHWVPEAGLIEMSGAGTTAKWLPRHVLWEVFSYPFDKIGCQAVFMRVSEKNQMWNGRGLPRLLKAYGFVEHHIARLYGRHEDGKIFILYDDVWRVNRFHKQHQALA